MVMRFDPFGDVDRLAQRLAGTMRETSSAMPMDAYRRGEEVVVHFDLPGVDPGSIDITAEQNTLTVRAERRWEPREDDRVIAQERAQGTFMRQLMLGEQLDTDSISASYEDGVLTLTIPVAAAAKPRRIEVRPGSSRQAQAIDVEATDTGAA